MSIKVNHWLIYTTLGLFVAATIGCSGGDSKPQPRPKPVASGGGEETEKQPEEESSAGSSSETPAATETQSAGSGSADEAPTEGGWGTLSGTFKFEGEAPEQGKLKITKDIEFCSKNNPLKEELVVNSENKGIKNIVVTLALGRGEEAPQAHESYAGSADAKVNMDNKFCRFEPHVQFVQTGQTLEFGNEDEVGHNVKGEPFANAPFNQTVAANSTLDVPIEAAERLPFQVSCTIHPWMSGWVIAQDHPYVAISDDDGNFELKNVPSGTWTFQLWQEKSGYLKQLKVKGSDTKLSRGRWEINVYDDAQEGNSAKNTFGDIVVPASNFE